jgi:hypothetical protein
MLESRSGYEIEAQDRRISYHGCVEQRGTGAELA